MGRAVRVGGDRSRDRRCGRAIAVVQSQLFDRSCGGTVVVCCGGGLCYVVPWRLLLVFEVRMDYLFTSSGYVRGSRASENKLAEVVGKCRYLVLGVFNALVVYAMLPGCLFMLEFLHYRHIAKSKQRRSLFA